MPALFSPLGSNYLRAIVWASNITLLNRSLSRFIFHDSSRHSRRICTRLVQLSAAPVFLYLVALLHCSLCLFITFCAPRFSSSMVFIAVDFSINQTCFTAHWPALGPITFIWVEWKGDNPWHKQRIRYNQQKTGTFIRSHGFDVLLIWAMETKRWHSAAVFVSVDNELTRSPIMFYNIIVHHKMWHKHADSVAKTIYKSWDIQ